MADPLHKCPQCGAEAPGSFCPACGAATDVSVCRGCSARLTGGARFCHRCGRRTVARPTTPWLVAGGIVVLALGGIGLAVAGGVGPGQRPDMANVGAPAGQRTAPDISRMSPRERFDRLFNRVMDAGARDDSAEVVQFTPMALGAYGQLDSIDASARMQAALIRIQVGEYAGASALADTILRRMPDHLFGYIIRGSVAHIQGDSAALRRSFAEFLGAYDREMAAGRPEYLRESQLIEQFHGAATGGPASK